MKVTSDQEESKENEEDELEIKLRFFEFLRDDERYL